jgi:hypothetical protein
MIFCKIREYDYFCTVKILLSITLFAGLLFLLNQQPQENLSPPLNLEGWWTMENGLHYFEDKGKFTVQFDGEDLWGMEEYYSEMVPAMGLPIQVIVVGTMTKDSLFIISQLDIAPEGCED